MNIIISEDSRAARILLQQTLEKLGYNVLSAENGRQAWEMVSQHKVNMVITDLEMPEMDGLALCKKIRASFKDEYVYIIMLTQLNDKSNQMRVFSSGADDYIPKPFDPEELKARIKTGVRIIELERGHKDLQKNISSSRDKLRIILDSLNEEIVSVDPDFSIISANRSFIGRSGSSFQDLIGKTISCKNLGFFNQSGSGKMLEVVKSVFNTGKEQSEHAFSGDTAENRLYKELTFLPVKDSQGEISQVVIVLRDITEQRNKEAKIYELNRELKDAFIQGNIKKKELEETMDQLKQTQAQVLHSEKMASIGQLAAGVAHEINNPTGFVSSNLKTLGDYQQDINMLVTAYRKLIHHFNDQLLEGKLPATMAHEIDQVKTFEKEVDIDFIQDDIQDLINDCREGTERIKKIVLDLKDFAHPGEDKLQVTDINKGLDSTLNVVNNELKYKANVVKDFGELPIIKCYPHQLNQVFMNILVNAAQAMENMGEIHIKTRLSAGNIEVMISDNGSGIPEENLTRIFDPFFTTKDVGKGTGLGMNIAYNIIKKHKGTINVESTLGAGTTFNIKLPVDEG